MDTHRLRRPFRRASDRLVGVKDLVVVSTSDAVMVVPRARAQDVRELVTKLKAAKRPEATDHKRVHRPWGYYESIDMGERFQVKRIVVIPGGDSVIAEAPAPRRALGRGARHRRGDHRRTGPRGA